MIGINKDGKLTKGNQVLEDSFIAWVDEKPRVFVGGVALKGSLRDLGLREEVYAIATKRNVDEETGEVTVRAIRPNGDIVITALNKNGEIVREKCLEIKA